MHLAHIHRTRAELDRGTLRRPGAATPCDARHPAFIADEGQQPDRQPCGEDAAVPGRGGDTAVPIMYLTERGIDRLPRCRQHVPHQEQQDADRDRVKKRAQGRRRAAQPAHRQAEHNGDAGDEPEQQCRSQPHAGRPFHAKPSIRAA
jgi:hypothetical protein